MIGRVKDLGDGNLTELVKFFQNLSGKIAQGQDASEKLMQISM
jgi:hypothetical protein